MYHICDIEVWHYLYDIQDVSYMELHIAVQLQSVHLNTGEYPLLFININTFLSFDIVLSIKDSKLVSIPDFLSKK